ncbi:MAG: hypothetical protein RLZZ387_522 [Chloroflexota bacterium]|jgi:putative phosphoribosyl transferase
MAGLSSHLLAVRAALPHDGEKRFGDRAAAGRRLAALLGQFRGSPALALAISPGGVPVAAELARALRIPLDVFVTREFRAPGCPAAVAGAVSEGGGLCLNGAALRLPGVAACAVWREAQLQQADVAALVGLYRGARPPAVFPRCPVILVDDGLGSGLAHLAALRGLRRYHPHQCILATPFGTEAALARVEHACDSVVCLEIVGSGEDDPLERWAWPVCEEEAAAMLARLRGQVGEE